MSAQDDRKKLEEAIQSSKVNVEHFEMLHTEMSRMLFTRYEGLIKAGFSEKQALTIICRRGIQ